MLVSELMTADVATCTPTSDLEHALYVMLEHDCGFVPIVTTEGRPVGVVTDRDICVAVAVRQRVPAQIPIVEAMSQPPFSCRDSDTVATALGTMTRHQIRRLPVVDAQGLLVGVLSLNDVVLAPHRPGGPTDGDVAETLRAISRHRVVEPALA